MIGLIVAALVRIAVFLGFDRPTSDGYHLTRRGGLLGWEETYIIAVTIPEFYIASWMATYLTDIFYQGIVSFLDISAWSVALGLLFAVRWFPAWMETFYADRNNGKSIVRSIGLFTSILWGIGLGAGLVVALHPDSDTLTNLYQYHLSISTFFLDQFQATLGLSLATLEPVVQHTIDVYENNAILALRAAGIGAVGGIAFGLGAPLILVYAVNAGVLWGVFTGILIRNSIAVGSWFAPVIGWFASTGLLVAGHTFLEFFAIMLIGLGGVFVALIWKGTDRAILGTKTVLAGLFLLGLAAVIEVWVDGPITGFLTGTLTIEPQLNPVISPVYPIAVIVMIITTVALGIGLAWATRLVTSRLEALL